MVKALFFQHQVSYLSHVVTAEGVVTDPAKIKVVKEWKHMCHLAELRSFLGFASYYRRFEEGVLNLAVPLHHLVVKASGPWQKGKIHIFLVTAWSEACDHVISF